MCYVCSSNVNPGCDSSPVNQTYLKNCSKEINGSKYDRCRKIEQWVDKDMGDCKFSFNIILEEMINDKAEL